MTETLRPTFPDIAEDERPYSMLTYGLPFDTACKKHIDGFLNVSRAYIIASKSLASKTDHLQRLEKVLADKHVGTWLGVPAHTPYASLIPVMDDIRSKNADCIITLGGGSLADGAKAISYALANNVRTLQDLTDLGDNFRTHGDRQYNGIGNLPTIKLIFMPTTLSGAEYSRYAGLTGPNHLKIQFTSPGMFASLIVLDEELYKSVPESTWLSTGVRAIDHCVENICSTSAKPAVDRASERGVVQLITSLLAYKNGKNDQLTAQLGANASMTGLALLTLAGASHGIGHQLGPLGVPHGITSCILLPAVMKHNAAYTATQQARIKNILWSDKTIASVLGETLTQDSDLGDALRAIFNHLDLPSTLKEVGIGRDKWEYLEVNSLDDGFIKVNPRPMTTREDVREVLEMVAGDK